MAVEVISPAFLSNLEFNLDLVGSETERDYYIIELVKWPYNSVHFEIPSDTIERTKKLYNNRLERRQKNC
jgi:hypothetical protein